MDIVELIKREHSKTNNLFDRLADTSNGAIKTRERLFSQLKSGLEVHSKVVQDLVYPLLRKQAETRDLIPDLKERNELKRQLAELEQMPKEEESFLQRLKEIRKSVEQHLRTEQRQIFPAIKKAIGGEEAEELAKRIAAETREELQEATQQDEDAAKDGGDTTKALGRGADDLARTVSRSAQRLVGEGAESAEQTASVAAAEAQRMTGIAARQVAATAENLEGARQAYSEMSQRAVERLRILATVPTAAISAFSELQHAWTDLIAQSVQRNARATQELFRCSSPADIAGVHKRFLEETMSGLLESNIRVLRATRRATDNALRPLEDEVERDQRVGRGQNSA